MGRTTEVTVNGETRDYDACVALMDNDLRETIHDRLAPCPDQEFVNAYCVEHAAKFGAPFTAD